MNTDLALNLPPSPIRVVGIGSSAGALGGYERFFLGLPPVNGLAFVVVPSLGPEQQGLMPGIVERCTSMPVESIEDGAAVQADRVYVLRPGAGLSISGGILHLGEPGDERIIDHFLETLAADQGEDAVAVILSGQGSDGTLGIRAIKERGGRVLIEDPLTAEYPQMPRSAAETELADDVLPIDELAARLLELIAPAQPSGAEALEQMGAEAPLGQVLRLIRAHTGHDFTRYKRTTLVRRTQRRMKTHAISDAAQYLRLLSESPGEVEALFQDFTINVTSFFRDTEAFEALKAQLRHYVQSFKQAQDTFRVWVAACSTGEEAYSVAIVLHELAEELSEGQHLTVQIFATDIDQAAINVARQGRYSKDIAYVLSPERLGRYFFVKDGQYQVRSDIRESVVFAAHSTFSDPPFTRLDLLCCRNMLIYVDSELQAQILDVFFYALRPGGLLFLGASETVGLSRENFSALSPRWKLFRRGEGPASVPPISGAFAQGEFAGAPTPLSTRRVSLGQGPELLRLSSGDLAGQVTRRLLADYAPSAVVVDAQGKVLHVHGHTARYLELPPGQLQSNVFEMVPASLRYGLQAAVRQAHSERREVHRRGLRIGPQSERRVLDVSVKPLQVSGNGPVLIVFRERVDLPEHSGDAGNVEARNIEAQNAEAQNVEQIRALEQELEYGRDSLQASVEEMAISLEELRSSNEELQTTNEELQSSNEELMTSKEELQSLNEELGTINAEHRMIIQDQGRANDDIRNLMENAEIATVFLSRELKIRKFTPLIAQIVRLAAADEGRSLADFSIKLRYPHLIRDAGRVLETLEPSEAQVQTLGGEWYLMRLNPYRTFENHIDGVVVTFTNIELIKSLEWRLVQSLRRAESGIDRLQDPLTLLAQHLRATAASRALLQALTERVKGQGDTSRVSFDLDELRRLLSEVVESEEPLSSSLLELSASQQAARQTAPDPAVETGSKAALDAEAHLGQIEGAGKETN